MEHSAVEIIAVALASSQNTNKHPPASTSHARSSNAKFSPEQTQPGSEQRHWEPQFCFRGEQNRLKATSQFTVMNSLVK